MFNQDLFSKLSALGVKTLNTTPLWTKGDTITAAVVDGTTCKLVHSKTLGLYQLGIVNPVSNELNLLPIDKDSEKYAIVGHTNWEVCIMKADRDFDGIALVGGKLVSREEFNTMIATGDPAAIIDTNRVDKGSVKIIAGQVKAVAFAVVS